MEQRKRFTQSEAEKLAQAIDLLRELLDWSEESELEDDDAPAMRAKIYAFLNSL